MSRRDRVVLPNRGEHQNVDAALVHVHFQEFQFLRPARQEDIGAPALGAEGVEWLLYLWIITTTIDITRH